MGRHGGAAGQGGICGVLAPRVRGGTGDWGQGQRTGDRDSAVGRAGRWHPSGHSGSGGGAACLQNCARCHVGHRAGNDRAAAAAPTAPGGPPRGARRGGDTQDQLGAHPACRSPRCHPGCHSARSRARWPQARCVCAACLLRAHRMSNACSPCAGCMACHPHVICVSSIYMLSTWSLHPLHARCMPAACLLHAHCPP